MFKKILMFSFMVAALNFSGALAGDVEKGKKLAQAAA